MINFKPNIPAICQSHLTLVQNTMPLHSIYIFCICLKLYLSSLTLTLIHLFTSFFQLFLSDFVQNTCSYYSQGWRPGRQEAPLNPDHNYFLLADNGTSGKFGGELGLRRRLEQYLAQQPIDMRRYGKFTCII